MFITHNIIYLLLVCGAIASFAFKKLTAIGAIAGLLCGLGVYQGGLNSLTMLALFFILGTLATRWKYQLKLSIGTAEERKGKRTAGQVLANGGVAALAGAIIWTKPDLTPLLNLVIAGSLAAATADTLSSELGTVYGRRFYNILTLRADKRGLDGVISLEGTIAGLAGAVVIAIVYVCGNQLSIDAMFIIVAGIIGNYADSLIGASAERRGWVGNNTVNLLNTLTGGLICLGLKVLSLH